MAICRVDRDGCNAAVEINQAEVPIKPMLEPMVMNPRSTENRTCFQCSAKNPTRRCQVGRVGVGGGEIWEGEDEEKGRVFDSEIG